jgi:hypothetical protein
MPISPAYLPSELHYIIPLAEQHGSEARVAVFDHDLGRHVQYSETLSTEVIAALRKLYKEISAKGHGPLINSWYRSHRANKTCPPETSWPIFGLLSLFAQLGRLGIVLFNDGAICPEDSRAEVLDWSKLLRMLAWVAAPAERYGHYQFDERILDFLRHATSADLAELRAVQRQWLSDSRAINAWLDKFDLTDHAEARLVYFTQGLLDMADGAGLL